MVNVHINFDKNNFKSKNSIERLKKKVKELNEEGYDNSLFQIDINLNDYLNDEASLDKIFNFDKINDDIFIKLSKKQVLPLNNFSEPESKNKSKKLNDKLRELEDKRRGIEKKELKEVKKNVDKNLYKRYEILKEVYDAPVVSPDVLINEHEKYIDQIEIFASGYMQITSDDGINDMIRDYHRIISEKVGIKLLTMDEFIVKYCNESGNPNEQLDLRINEDSGTESDED